MTSIQSLLGIEKKYSKGSVVILSAYTGVGTAGESLLVEDQVKRPVFGDYFPPWSEIVDGNKS